MTGPDITDLRLVSTIHSFMVQFQEFGRKSAQRTISGGAERPEVNKSILPQSLILLMVFRGDAS